MSSSAAGEKNSLSTGTLGWSDIANRAAYSTEQQSVGISTGGSIGSQFAGNVANGLLSGMNGSGDAEGTTRAAVAEGTVTVRDGANQQQAVAALSRDTAGANGRIGEIFDREKEQTRMREVQLLSEIGSQVSEIAQTQGKIAGLNAGRKELAAKGMKEPEKDAPEERRRAYSQALTETKGYEAAQKRWGTGSAIQRGIQAATGALQGLAGGNIAGAIAGASAPELANLIGHSAGLEDNTAAKTVAHALLGGVVASLNGGSAVAGAVGGATGELAAAAIASVMYPEVKSLTEEQKETVSTLATIAAGMAGGLAGGSVADATTGAQAGKNSAINNALGNVLAAAEASKKGTTEKWQEQQQAAIKEACSGNTPISCETAVAAMGSAMAWPLLPGAAATTSLVGAGANAGIGLLINGEVNPDDVILSYWTGAFTANTGLLGTMGVNALNGATSSYIKGDDPLKGGAINGAAAGLGYGAGKLLQGQLDKVLNPNWKNWEWVDIGMGISKPMSLTPLPGMAGNTLSSAATETFNDQLGKATVNNNEEKR